jgi:hypothetical protein
VDPVEELDVLRARGARGRARRAGEADQRVEERVAALFELGRLADADEAAAVLDVRLQRASCSALRTLPAELTKTTARYVARFAAAIVVASDVTSTV